MIALGIQVPLEILLIAEVRLCSDTTGMDKRAKNDYTEIERPASLDTICKTQETKEGDEEVLSFEDGQSTRSAVLQQIVKTSILMIFYITRGATAVVSKRIKVRPMMKMEQWRTWTRRVKARKTLSTKRASQRECSDSISHPKFG